MVASAPVGSSSNNSKPVMVASAGNRYVVEVNVEEVSAGVNEVEFNVAAVNEEVVNVEGVSACAVLRVYALVVVGKSAVFSSLAFVHMMLSGARRTGGGGRRR